MTKGKKKPLESVDGRLLQQNKEEMCREWALRVRRWSGGVGAPPDKSEGREDSV